MNASYLYTLTGLVIWCGTCCQCIFFKSITWTSRHLYYWRVQTITCRL